MKLADRIVRNSWVVWPRLSDTAKAARPDAERAIIIRADNVGEYYKANTKDQFKFGEDFLTLTPPFADVIITWKSDALISNPGSEETAVYIHTDEAPDNADGEQAKWLITIFVFVEGENEDLAYMAPALFYLKLDKNGDALPFKTARVRYGIDPVACEQLGIKEPSSLLMFLNIPLLALTLLHCRNVEMAENTVPEKLRRKRIRKNKVVPLRFYTLEISGVKRMLSNEGRIKTGGLGTALHICRGHFKDYREHGLYGKYKGVYWWADNVRGNAKKGIIKKEYSINTEN